MSIEGRFVYGDGMCLPDEYLDETWERINGPEDYFVSNKGRIWSCSSQKFVKPKKADHYGHLGVCLSNHGKVRYAYVHRLVAEAFVCNREKGPVVRHLDDDPDNNWADNLSWGTVKDNIRDSIERGSFHYITNEEREKWLTKSRKPIYGINKKTGERKYFRSQTDAGKELGIPQANINKVLLKQRPKAGGYFFDFAEE